MLFTEWNMDEALAVTAEEARAEGEARGRAAGKIEGERSGLEKGRKQEQIKMIRALDGVLSAEVIAEKLGLPLEYVQEILKKQ